MCFCNAHTHKKHKIIPFLTIGVKTEKKNLYKLTFLPEFILIPLEMLYYKNNEKRFWFKMVM